MMTTMHRSGLVALVGRPNVGKSTLLNRLVGQKISITTHKAQTTRHRILGIKTRSDAQLVYVDTPGLHRRAHRTLNRYMNRAATDALADVDLVFLMVDGLRWTDEDDWVLERVRQARAPLFLVANKVDRIPRKEELLPHLDALSQKADFAEVVPISARNGTNVQTLEDAAVRYLPEGPPFYPEEQVTDRSERFLAAELIREQCMARLSKEVPYSLAVEIEEFKEEDSLLRIGAVLWLERPGQKAIVIGRGGQFLKEVGAAARREMEAMFERKIYLRLWVKVREGWADQDRWLRDLGLRE